MSADSPGVPPPYVPPPPPGYPAPPAPPSHGSPAPFPPPDFRPPPDYRPPPAPAPVASITPARGGTLRRLLGMLLALGLVAAASFAGAAAYDDLGVRTPATWDPRVAPLAEFVEQHRQLKFLHPVRVYFLSEREYARASGGSAGTPSAADRREARRTAAEYRALGVLQGDPDLLDARRTMQESGTLAYYTPIDKVINVRGTTLTPSRRVTIVHELTHALQDQHFRLSRLTDIAEPDPAGAARAVIEGDAVATEQAYIDTLSPADAAAYDAETTEDQEQATDDLDDVPDVLQTVFGSYYAVGNAFVDFWDATPNGEPNPRNLDEVLRRPPPTSAQLYDPGDYIDRAEPADVTAPEVVGSTTEFRTGSLGAGFLFVMLSERIAASDALAAIDGLQGDAYRSALVPDVDGAERMCVKAAFSLASNDDARELAAALERWSATMPDGAGVEIDEPDSGAVQVGLRTCDAGARADVGLTGRSSLALVVPIVRLKAAADAVSQGYDRDGALCFGTSVVGQLTVDELNSPDRSPAVDAAIEVAGQECS